MKDIQFGTDGWRAIIAENYTTANLMRVAKATADWIHSLSHQSPSVVIGHDCRFGGDLFARTTARVMAHEGIKVFLGDHFATTPMISLGANKLKASAGVVITASHNPPEYNGFKIKAGYGGPAIPAMISEVENRIPEKYDSTPPSLHEPDQQNMINRIDLEKLYVDHAREHFDLEAIRNSNLQFAYDAMYGAGQSVLKQLLPQTQLLHCEQNPSFKNTPPEPIMKNLQEFSSMIREDGNITSGLATDGDADRLGLLDSQGHFVDSHHLILMLINYLHKHKGYSGSVVHSFSCTSKIKKLCEKFGLSYQVTRIGFKYICEIMTGSNGDDVLVGGEESGGIAVKGHIPERDGIWIGLTIWEYMAKSGKTINDLIREIYDLVGPFAVERNDLPIREEQKQKIMEQCRNGQLSAFGPYKAGKVENIDGYKYHLDEEKWVMIRPSGTEPILRTYAEAPTSDEAIKILEHTRKTLLGI